MDDTTRRLVAALRAPRAYPHPVGDVELVETHISYVLLAGGFAYKIKKPVRLHFVDYSNLETRRYFCEEEVRLNARTAPGIYLDVVPIGGSIDAPVVGGRPAIEYAVRMRRFPGDARFEQLVRARRLEPGHVDALAAEIARLHERARPSAPGTGYGSPGEVLGCALDNFHCIGKLEEGTGGLAVPRELHDWTLAEHHALRDTFAERRAAGYVREGHGDLHLGNVVLLDERPVIFDCIEFNAGFRWIDVMNDLAFAVMDLHAHGHPDLAARLLNGYLERTGDYGGLRVLRFYLAYRAMVRAKVACIRAHQPHLGEDEIVASRAAFAAHVKLASRLSRRAPPAIVLMHGLSGSGKTRVSGTLVEQLGAVRLRSDVVRKELAGLAPLARTASGIGAGLYGAGQTERTYREMARRAGEIVASGYPAVIDATFMRSSQRRHFHELAARRGVPLAIVDCTAPEALLGERIAQRARAGGDASEANSRVLDWQIATGEPLDAGEREISIRCDGSLEHAADLVAELLARDLARAEWERPCATSTSSTATPTASARYAS